MTKKIRFSRPFSLRLSFLFAVFPILLPALPAMATSTAEFGWERPTLSFSYRESIGSCGGRDFHRKLYRVFVLERYIASLSAAGVGPLPKKISVLDDDLPPSVYDGGGSIDINDLPEINKWLSEVSPSWAAALAKLGTGDWDLLSERFPEESTPTWDPKGEKLFFLQRTLKGRSWGEIGRGKNDKKLLGIALEGAPIPQWVQGKICSIRYECMANNWTLFGFPIDKGAPAGVPLEGLDEVCKPVEGTQVILRRTLPMREEDSEVREETLVLDLSTWKKRKIPNIPDAAGFSNRQMYDASDSFFALDPGGKAAVKLRHAQDESKKPPENVELLYWVDLVTGKSDRVAKIKKPLDLLGWMKKEDRALFLRAGSGVIESIGREGDLRKEVEADGKGTFVFPYDDFGLAKNDRSGRYGEEGPLPSTTRKYVLTFSEDKADQLDRLGLLRKGRKAREIQGVGSSRSSEPISGLWIVLEKEGGKALDLKAFTKEEKVSDVVISPSGEEIGYVSWSSGLMKVHRKKFDRLDPNVKGKGKKVRAPGPGPS